MPLYIDCLKLLLVMSVLTVLCSRPLTIWTRVSTWEHKPVIIRHWPGRTEISGWYWPLSTACEEGHQRDQRRILRCGGSLGVRRQTPPTGFDFFFFLSYIPEFLKHRCHHTWRTWVLFLMSIFSYLLADQFWHLSINTLKIPPQTIYQHNHFPT